MLRVLRQRPAWRAVANPACTFGPCLLEADQTPLWNFWDNKGRLVRREPFTHYSTTESPASWSPHRAGKCGRSNTDAPGLTMAMGPTGNEDKSTEVPPPAPAPTEASDIFEYQGPFSNVVKRVKVR